MKQTQDETGYNYETLLTSINKHQNNLGPGVVKALREIILAHQQIVNFGLKPIPFTELTSQDPKVLHDAIMILSTRLVDAQFHLTYARAEAERYKELSDKNGSKYKTDLVNLNNAHQQLMHQHNQLVNQMIKFRREYDAVCGSRVYLAWKWLRCRWNELKYILLPRRKDSNQ